MEQCKDDKGSCAVDNSIVGMVIGGRAARACDVCGTERARWYCAADLAYLCDRCDGSVHSANAVARRHERARLGPNGAPVKTAQKLAPTTSVKRDAAAAGPFSAATLNPRKKPRSIRRHKPSSMHIASKQCISTSHTSNHINSSPSKLNASLIYAPNYSIMINNPRNDLDYIANSNIELNNQFVVKAEPYSPTDMGDQVKVPDHTDDDPLFEALFDFRDLQDDDLFLHQVPIYNPLQNQDNSPTVDTKPCVVIGHEEIKPTTIITPLAEESKEPGLSKYRPCAAIPPSELSQAELDSNSSSTDRDAEVKEALPIRKCEEPDRFVDSGNCLCDLDQLDFDSMLHGHDEDGDEESHASHMSAFPGHENPDYIDASDCHITRDDSGSYAADSCAHHGNGNMDGEDFDDNYEAVDEHAGYGGEAFDFDAMESESPRTWLCKVKVESAPDDAELHGLMQVNGAHADALLKEKLTDTQYSGLKLGLKLNFEDVLHAWSDRGTFWMDGHPPPQMNCLDFLGGWLVPDMSSTSATDADGQQLVPVLNQKSKKGNGSAREASVLRYREKRRTRLFCKKIRYEVRKLNAEKRPRMKGRFVKRISIVV